jgi:hypothetical protein
MSTMADTMASLNKVIPALVLSLSANNASKP